MQSGHLQSQHRQGVLTRLLKLSSGAVLCRWQREHDQWRLHGWILLHRRGNHSYLECGTAWLLHLGWSIEPDQV